MAYESSTTSRPAARAGWSTLILVISLGSTPAAPARAQALPGIPAPPPAAAAEKGAAKQEIAAPTKDNPEATVVESSGKINVDKPVDESRVKQFLEETLAKYPGVDEIHAEVNGSVVTLTGHVEDEHVRDRLSQVALKVEGVVFVANQVKTDAQFDAWFTLTTQLRQNFDDVCGDTFCEGDYSNIESLRLRCSVLQDSGRIGRCVWIFAASNEDIDRAFGRILVQTQDWECRLPIASDTGIDELMAALAGDSPLFAMLPGTQTTIYEGLGDCL